MFSKPFQVFYTSPSLFGPVPGPLLRVDTLVEDQGDGVLIGVRHFWNFPGVFCSGCRTQNFLLIHGGDGECVSFRVLLPHCLFECILSVYDCWSWWRNWDWGVCVCLCVCVWWSAPINTRVMNCILAIGPCCSTVLTQCLGSFLMFRFRFSSGYKCVVTRG